MARLTRSSLFSPQSHLQVRQLPKRYGWLHLNYDLRAGVQAFLEEPITGWSAYSGTSFVQALKVQTVRRSYFLKYSSVETPVFFAEAHGLEEIKKTGAIDVVEVMGVADHFLLLDFVESSPLSADGFYHFGIALAQMHRHRSAHCGFYEDNFLGATPQLNGNPHKLPWPAFFWHRRLLPQCQWAVDNALIGSGLAGRIHQLEPMVYERLQTAEPPALLHGDLWSGNYLVNSEGRVCLIDPAICYGHREAEFALARMFGGFPAEFYRGYDEHFPLMQGAEERLSWYQLYHLLNHLNLFGRSYLAAVEGVVSSLLPRL